MHPLRPSRLAIAPLSAKAATPAAAKTAPAAKDKVSISSEAKAPTASKSQASSMVSGLNDTFGQGGQGSRPTQGGAPTSTAPKPGGGSATGGSGVDQALARQDQAWESIKKQMGL